MTFNSYYDLDIKLPDLDIQNSIAKVLSDLDAKIELNNKINQELEAMAKTLYDYWFVQFDFPNEQGKPYKSSGGSMVYNEELKREIPEGWEVKELWDVAVIKAGGDKPTPCEATITETCRIPVYANGVINDGLYGYTDNPKIKKQSITISARGTIGYCVLRNEPFVPIIRLLSVTPKLDKTAKFYFEQIRSLVFNNSGSVQQQLTVPQLNLMKVIQPVLGILNRYDLLTASGVELIENNKKQNKKLESFRDWLLPMLMNGQVTVS